MKVICDGLALSDAVSKVIKAIPVKKNNSILESIKFMAYDNILTLLATDLELAIKKSIVADVKIEGEALIPAKFFAELIRSLSTEQLKIDTSDGKEVTIEYADNKGTIKCGDVSEYPNIEEVEKKAELKISKKDLKDVINKTIFAAATEDKRPILKGCLFEVNKEKLTVVALDGYRLALCNKNLEGADNKEEKFVIPARSLFEISKLIENEENEITLIFDKDKMLVEVENTVIITRLLSGEFINYKNIILKEFNTTAVFSREQFANSVGRASIISRMSKNKLVKIEIKENFITVDSNSEAGNIHESIPSKTEGKDNIICFNGQYLLDFINVISDDFIKMNIKASNSPCIFTQVDGEEYIYLILPMRVTS
jgi:DNA polymerase-3 subunit beta